jgi:hypothetical protein
MKICSDVKDELLDDYLVLHIFSFADDTLDPHTKADGFTVRFYNYSALSLDVLSVLKEC